MLGIGVNVAVASSDLPPELRDTAATLGLEPRRRRAVLERLLRALERWLGGPRGELLDAWRARDALRGRTVALGRAARARGRGRRRRAAAGRARRTASGVALDAGEVHLARPPRGADA